jgi:hypothetical protein
MKRMASGVLLVTLLTSVLCSVFNIVPVRVSGAVNVRADGSVDPPRARMQQDGLGTFSEPPSIEWNRTYAYGDRNEAYSLVPTSDGGYALAGWTTSEVSDYDLLLIKTDSLGNVQWNKTYNQIADTIDVAYSLVQTTDNGYALAGFSGFNTGSYGAWLAKTNEFGCMQWNLQFYIGVEDTYPFSVVQTTDGGFALVGTATIQLIGYRPCCWLVKVAGPIHDVAITNIVPSKTVVGQGYSLNISVTAANKGDYTENFNVTAYASAVGIGSGLVGYWSLDEGRDTTAHDPSGNNNHGTIDGASWTDGKFGKALSFDGADDCVEIPLSPSLFITDEITITAWIYPLSLESSPDGLESRRGGIVVHRWWNEVTDHIFTTFGTSLEYNVHTADGWFTFTQSGLAPMQWQHVAVRVNATKHVFLYINGVEYYKGRYTGTITSTFLPWIIGRKAWAKQYFNGTIDEVRVYNRALNQQEIGAIAGSGLIQTQTITLSSGTSTILPFTWTTVPFAKGNYTISAVAEMVPGETNKADNTLIDG